jgi:hypothetical protein
MGVIPGSELDRALRHGPFSRALRAAIAERGMSLDRLHRRLVAQGVTVSPATLSYWQRGKSLPKHDESMAAVRLLEQLLELPDGSLTQLLRSWAKTDFIDRQLWPNVDSLAAMLEGVDMSGADRLTRLSVHDHYEVDGEQRERAGWTRSVFRALDDGVDRLVTIWRADDEGGPLPVLTKVRFCSLGKLLRDPESGFLAAELLFDRPLTTGETVVIEVATAYESEAPAARNFDRRFGHPVGQYVLQVSFDPEALPRVCASYLRDAVDAPERDRRELWLGPSNSVHVVANNVTHGICGIDIDWG